MANDKPNPNLISEEQFFEELSSGKIHEIDRPPVVAGNPGMTPPPSSGSTIPTLSGSLPLGMQFPQDLQRTALPGVPSQRLWPVAPAGTAGTNSAVTSGTKGISNTANQANKTAASANTTAKGASAAVTVVSSTPVMQVDSGGTVTQAPVSSLGSGAGATTPTIDNLGDGLTYNRFLAAHMYLGGILPAHVNGQLASIDIGTITQVASIGGANAVAGWQVRGAATIGIPPGLNSITFILGTAALVASGSGSFDLGTGAGQGWGVAIFSGSAPATPGANSNGVLTQNSTVTVISPAAGLMNIAFYTYWIGGSHLGLLNNGALFGIHTVLPCSASAIT